MHLRPKKCTINIFIQIKIILFELLFTSVPADCCSADPELKCHVLSCAYSEGGGGGQGVRTPLENYKNIGFLSNTGPGPLKITKLPIQHSMLAFKWRFAGGPLMVRL